MSGEFRRRAWKWLQRAARMVLVTLALGAGAIAVFVWSGAAERTLRRSIVHRLEAMTGGKVELKEFSVRWLSLRATLKGLVIHGHEPEGTEPFIAVEEVQLGLRVDSFWGRKISLDEVNVRAPRVHLRIEKTGFMNLPLPPRRGAAAKLAAEQLFDLRVRKIAIANGWILYNDLRVPLAIEGGALQFSLNAAGAPENSMYLGSLEWKDLSVTAERYYPAPVNLSAKFTLSRGSFAIEQALVQFAGSQIDAQAELAGFADPRWKFRYRGWLRLEDIRRVVHKPMTPGGRIDIRGEGSFAGGEVRMRGEYSAHEIAMDYPVFSASGLASRGTYILDNHGIEVPDFRAQAFEGDVSGRVSLRFTGMVFRAETHARGLSLAEVLDSVDRPDFPVNALNWGGIVSANTVEIWNADFKQFEIAGETHWAEPEQAVGRRMPAAGDVSFHYRNETRVLQMNAGEITTPSSHVTFGGRLAAQNSDLEMHFETGDLSQWNAFFHAIERFSSREKVAPVDIAGSAHWDGRILGPLSGPNFTGHIRGERVSYGWLSCDLFEADVSYSPDGLSITHGRVNHGATVAEVDASLELSDWSFKPENDWTAEANVTQSSLESLQALLGLHYAASGNVTGQFHGRGTRATPSVTGLFDFADGRVDGVAINHLRGQLNLSHEEFRIANAELRVFARGNEGGQAAGVITGTAGYRFADKSVSLDLVGAGFPLESFEKIQTARVPIAGRLSFHVQAQGPLQAPQGEGSFRIVDLRLGQEVIGSFDGKLASDGNEARLELNSAMSTGKIAGTLRAGLHGDFPLNGKISVSGISLDPLLVSALHLPPVTGRGSVDGEFELGGALAQPKDISVEGTLSRFVLNDANVRLENAGPVRFRYAKQELRLERSAFRGADTNFEIAGMVQFSGERHVDLLVSGAMDLRLLSSYSTDVEMRGPAQINATVEGTLDRPRVNGKVHIENASVRVQDFPTGLSALTGDLVFDATRVFFENVTAQAGGGKLQLSGTVNFADTPLRYDVTARAAAIRIRYPEGMSWLAGGSLRLTGTPQAGLLSGRVTIDRVTMTEGLQVAGALVAMKEGISAPTTTSPYLRNLQFDIEAVSAPESRLEWPGAELVAEANLRVRGTWEHPILLGHIHILSGELTFAGNRYRVSRGDLNFANPFRLDPVLNVEATTTIQQYEITLNFNGPASKLTLAYRSDPPLPPNDIVTLLALGKTSSEAETRSSGVNQGGTAGASELLSEAISSQLGGRLERLFGITRLRVDPGLGGLGSTSASQNSAARVSVEQRVARNLTITYITNVTSTQQQIIQVEYNITRNVSIIALRDQNGTFALDVVMKKRFP